MWYIACGAYVLYLVIYLYLRPGSNGCNLAHGQRPLKRIPVNQFRYNYRSHRSSASTISDSSHIMGIVARVESNKQKRGFTSDCRKLKGICGVAISLRLRINKDGWNSLQPTIRRLKTRSRIGDERMCDTWSQRKC